MRLISDRLCLSASRRSRAPRLGLVGRRVAGGGAVAAVSSAERRLSAASRFRNWERCSDAVTVSTPPVSRAASARRARSLSTGPSASERATSYETSTRLSVVLTDCPPGPDDRENRQDSSSGGITAPRMWIGAVTSPMIRCCPRPAPRAPPTGETYKSRETRGDQGPARVILDSSCQAAHTGTRGRERGRMLAGGPHGGAPPHRRGDL